MVEVFADRAADELAGFAAEEILDALMRDFLALPIMDVVRPHS